MSTTIKIYLLGLNLAVLGFIFHSTNLEYIGVGILLLGVLYYLVFHRSTLNPVHSTKTLFKGLKQLPGLISFGFEYARIHKRYILVTAIAIALGVAALSQAYMTVNLQNDRLYADATKNVEYPGLRIEAVTDGTLQSSNLNYTDQFIANYTNGITNLESQARANAGLSNRLKSQRWVSYIKNLNYYDPEIKTVVNDVTILTSPSSLFSLLSENWGELEGRLPVYPNETIAIKAPGGLPDVQPSFEVNESVTVFYRVFHRYQSPETYETNYTIVGTILLKQYELAAGVSWADLNLSPVVFYVSQSGFMQAFNDYEHKAAIHHVQAFYYDFTQQYIPQIVSYLESLKRESLLLSNSFYLNSVFISKVRSPLEDQISWASSILEPMEMIFLYLALPIIGLAILLANLSFNLQEKKHKRLIAGMKARGISSGQLMASNLALIFYSGLVGFIFGVALGFPLSYLMVKSSGFLQFNNDVSYPYLTLSQLLLVFLLTFLVSLDTSLLDLLNINDVSITDEDAVDELSKPIWRKYHIDLILTVLGLYLAYFTLDLADNPAFNVSGTVLMLLGIISLIATVAGVIFLSSWYLGRFIIGFGSFLMIFFDSVFTLSFKNLKLKRALTSKLTVIMIISASFLIFLLITPVSIQNHAQEAEHYKIGSDLVIEDVDFQDVDYQRIIPNIEGIQSFTEMYIITFQAEYNGKTDYFTVAGINTTTFKEAAYFKDSYLVGGVSLDLMLEDLQYKSASYTWYDMAVDRKLRLGEAMEFNVIPQLLGTNLEHTVSARLYLDGVFKFMPRVITEKMYRDQFYFVTSLETVFNLQNEISPQNIINTKSYSLIRAVPGTNLAALRDRIFSASVAQFRFSGIHYVGEELINTSQAAFLVNVNSYIFIGFFYAVAFSILALIFYSQLSLLERKREVGVFKSLGMVSRQLLSMFMAEITFILLFTLPIGLVLGVFMSVITIRLMRTPEFGAAIPPIYPVYPWDFISYAYLILFAISILSVLLPAFKYARTKAGEVMMVEE